MVGCLYQLVGSDLTGGERVGGEAAGGGVQGDTCRQQELLCPGGVSPTTWRQGKEIEEEWADSAEYWPSRVGSAVGLKGDRQTVPPCHALDVLWETVPDVCGSPEKCPWLKDSGALSQKQGLLSIKAES